MTTTKLPEVGERFEDSGGRVWTVVRVSECWADVKNCPSVTVVHENVKRTLDYRMFNALFRRMR